MNTPLRVLIVEDSEDDAVLLLRELRRSGYDIAARRVDTPAEMTRALAQQSWDLVISDYAMPHFDGLRALRLLQEKGLDLPFILVSGTIGEERAVNALKAGAHDFIIKGNWARLIPAIERELRESENRRQKQRAEESLKQSEAQLREAERKYRALVENIPSVVYSAALDDPGGARYVSPQIEGLLGFTAQEWLADPELWATRLHPDDRAWALEAYARAAGGQPFDLEYRLLARDGRVVWVRDRMSAVLDEQGQPTYRYGTVSDITARKQDEEQIRLHAARAQALADISQMFAASAYNYQSVLDTAIQRITQLLGDACAIYLVSDDGQWLQPAALYHPDPALIAALRDTIARAPLRVGEGVSASVVKAGQPVLMPVVNPEQLRAMLKPEYAPLLDRVAIHSLLTVPLRAGEPLLGVLTLVRLTDGRPYGADDQTFAQNVADRLAQAILNARLFAETERRLANLRALREIDLAIASSTDMRLTLKTVLDQVAGQLQVDAALIMLLNPNTMMLEVAARKGFRGPARRTRLRLGEELAGRAALERHIIRSTDMAEPGDGQDTSSYLSPSEGFVSYVAVPLIAKGQVKGVLNIFHRAPLKPDAAWDEFLETLAGQAAIAIDSAQLFDGLQRSNSELLLAYDTTIEGWSRALDLRDRETEGHTLRVTELTLRLARAAGMDEDALVHVRRGALLHDIGKMGVPDAILLKPEPLTDEEWLVMHQHPGLAYDLLSPIPFLKPALDIPYCHHEKWDGTGYPRGLKGEQIPLAARLFAVVDVWDALRSDRPYRAAWPEERVREHIRSLAGTHFDPKVVEGFINGLR